MYLLNAADNMTRRGFYLVDAVPWIEIDGGTFAISGNNRGRPGQLHEPRHHDAHVGLLAVPDRA